MQRTLLIITLVCFYLAVNALGAERIVSLAPSITEVIFLLDLEDQLVGVTANCDYPPAAGKIEKVGAFGVPNLERIANLKPDLVLTPDLGNSAVITRLQELNIPVLILPEGSVSDVLAGINKIGAATGRGQEAMSLASSIEADMQAVRDKLTGSLAPSVLVVIWVNPNAIMTTGKRSFVGELVEMAGGDNIAAEIGYAYPMIGPEFVLAEDPEVIILGDGEENDAGVKTLLGLPGIKNTRAVKTGRICRNINPDLLLRPGPRLAEGLRALARVLHPELFTVEEQASGDNDS